MQQLNAELKGWLEIQKNQAHPQQFGRREKRRHAGVGAARGRIPRIIQRRGRRRIEFIDAEAGWIHVQISGAARGYIRRSGLDLPASISARLEPQAAAAAEKKPEVFRIEREENSTFTFDWEPLKGKAVKIYTVQPASDDSKQTRASAKLSFASSLFRKFSADTAADAPPLEGAVVIFDSADGGIMDVRFSARNNWPVARSLRRVSGKSVTWTHRTRSSHH